MIMRKDDLPLLRDGPREEPLLLRDPTYRIEIVSHHPRRIQMMCRRQQVPRIADMSTARLHMHRHHLRRVAWKALHPDPRHDLRRRLHPRRNTMSARSNKQRGIGREPTFIMRIDKRHLPRSDQRIVVRRQITHLVAVELQVTMRHLTRMSEVTSIRKRRTHRAIRIERRVPPAVIEVQMRVDHHIDLFGTNSSRRQRRRQKLLVLVNLLQLRRLLVADAGFDQHRMLARPYDRRVHAQEDTILLIGHDPLLPQRLRDHTEHRTAIQQVCAIRTNRQLELADRMTPTY